MIVFRIIEPVSKLATLRDLALLTAFFSLGEELDFREADEDDMLGAMHWLFEGQEAIENALARRHRCKRYPGPPRCHLHVF